MQRISERTPDIEIVFRKLIAYNGGRKHENPLRPSEATAAWAVRINLDHVNRRINLIKWHPTRAVLPVDVLTGSVFG